MFSSNNKIIRTRSLHSSSSLILKNVFHTPFSNIFQLLFFFLISLVAHSQTKVAFPISSLSAADQAKLQNLHYGCDNLVDVVDDPGFGQHLSYNYTALSGYKYTDVLVGFNLNDPEFSISSYPTLAFGYKESLNNIPWGSGMYFRHWFTLQSIVDGNLNDSIIDDPFSSDPNQKIIIVKQVAPTFYTRIDLNKIELGWSTRPDNFGGSSMYEVTPITSRIDILFDNNGARGQKTDLPPIILNSPISDQNWTFQGNQNYKFQLKGFDNTLLYDQIITNANGTITVPNIFNSTSQQYLRVTQISPYCNESQPLIVQKYPFQLNQKIFTQKDKIVLSGKGPANSTINLDFKKFVDFSSTPTECTNNCEVFSNVSVTTNGNGDWVYDLNTSLIPFSYKLTAKSINGISLVPNLEEVVMVRYLLGAVKNYNESGYNNAGIYTLPTIEYTEPLNNKIDSLNDKTDQSQFIHLFKDFQLIGFENQPTAYKKLEIVRPSDWNQKSAVGFIYNGTQTNKRPEPEVENLYFNVGGSTSQYMLNSNLKLSYPYTTIEDRDQYNGDYLIREDPTSLTITEVGKKHGLYTFFGQMPRYATYGDNVSTYEYRDTTRYESYDYTKNKIGFVDPFSFGNNYRNFTFPNVSTGDYAYKEKFDGFPLVNPKGNPFESYFTPTNPSEKVLNNQFGYGGTLSFKSNNFVFTPNDFGVTDTRLKGINNTNVLRNWQISSILHNIVYLNQGDLRDTTEINRTFYALLTRTDNTVDTIKVTVKLLPTDDLGSFYFGSGNQTSQFVPSNSTIRKDDIPSNAIGFYDTFSGYTDTKNPDPVLSPINKYFNILDYDYNTNIDVDLRYEFPNLPTVKTVQNDTIFLENSMFKLKISNKISNITAPNSATNLQFPFNISFKSIDKFSPVDIGAGLLRFVFKDKRTGNFRGYIAYNFDPQFVIDDIIFTGVSNFPNFSSNISYFPTSPLFNVTNADFVDGDQSIKGFKSVSLKVDGLQYFLDEYIKSSISGDLILLKNANTNGTLFNGTVTYVVTPNNNKTSSTIIFTFPAGYSNTQLKDFINSFQFVTKFGNLDKWTDGQKTITITSIQKYATTNFEITNPLVAYLNVIGNADKYFENDITKFNIFNSTHSPIGSSVFNNSFDFSSAILTFSPLLNGGSSALIQSDDRYEFIANNVSINGNNISVNNTIIGTYSIANNVVTCTLNSSANPSLVDELIKSFTYSNTSQDPALKAIQIDWRLSKLSNEITGSNFFFCIPINDPPTFSFESVINKEFLPGQQIGQNGSVIEYSKIKLFEKLNSSNNLVNVPVSISTIEANQNITQIKFKVTASDSWISVNSYVEEYLIINNNAHRLNSSTFVENGLNFAFSVSGNVVTCTIDNPLNKSIQEITDLLSNMYYTTNAASTNINLNPTRLFEFTSITDNGFNEINSTNSVFNKNFSDLIYNDTQNRLKITFKSNAVINAIPYTYLSTPANLTSLGDYPTNRLKLDLWTSYKESAGYNETTQYIKKFKLKVSNVYPSSSQETGTEKIQISSTLLDLGINSSGTINNIPYVLTYDNSSKESIITFGADNSNFGNAIGSDQTTLSTFLSSIKYFNIDETPATNIRSFTLYNFIDNLDAVSTQEVKLFVSPVAPPALPFSISWKQNYNFSNDEGGENIVKLVLNGTIPASAYDYDNNGTPSYLLALAFTINDGRTTISSTSPYFRNITFSSGPSSPYLVIPNSLALNNLEIDLKISSIDDAVINNSQYYSYGLNVKEMASANYLGTVSSTPNYFLLTYSDPTFTIRDNDIPIMTITPTSKTVYEGQLNQSINVKLNLFPQKNPTNEITKVFVERVKLDGSIETDNTEINNFPTFFYFTNKRAGEGYETVITKDVNFDALLDATADGDQVVRLKFTVEKTYSVTCNGSLPCTIDYNNPSSYTIGSGSTTPFTNLTSTALINVKDVDIPLIFSENNLISQDIPEGTTKNFKIYLNDIPKNITITNNDSSLFEITQTNLAFSGTGLINGIVLSVKAIENSNYGNFTGTITLSDPTNFYAQPLILNVTGIDNDAKVVISPTTFPTGLTWTGNSTVTFSVALASLPTNNVNVNLSVPAYTIPNPPGSGNPSESKMYPIKLGTNQNLVLNFTPQNGTTPQTVTASVFLMGQNGNLLNSSATNFNSVIGNFTSQSININTSTSADPVYAALSNTTYPYSIAKSTTSTGGGTSSGTSGATTTTNFFNSWKCILQNGEDVSNGTVYLLPAGGPPAGSGATYSLIYTLSDGSTQTYTVTDSRSSSTIPLSFIIPNSFLQSLTAANYPNGVKFEFKVTIGGNSLSFGGSSFTIDKTQAAGSNNDNGVVQCPIAPVAAGQTPSASANLVMGSAHSWTNIMTGGTDGILDNCEAQTNGNLKFLVDLSSLSSSITDITQVYLKIQSPSLFSSSNTAAAFPGASASLRTFTIPLSSALLQSLVTQTSPVALPTFYIKVGSQVNDASNPPIGSFKAFLDVSNTATCSVTDITPPAAPIVSSANATTVTGTAEANSVVKVYASNGTTLLGTATTNSSGVYAVTLVSAQTNGTVLKLSATDAAGNVSSLTTGTVAIDTTAPTVVLTHSGSDLIVRDADTETITATFSEAMTSAPTITLTLSNGTNITAAALSGSGTTWTYAWNVPAGSDGTATVTLAGTDLAGNAYAGTTNLVFTIDNTAPSAPVVNSQTTNNPTPTLTGTSEPNATIIVSVNGSTYTTTANGSGAWSITSSNLPSGTYSVTATATDAAGNVSPVGTGSVTIDNIAPVVYQTGTTTAISSNPYTITTPENQLSVYDFDANETVNWTISGTNANLFTINQTTGAIVFNSAPDYETNAGPFTLIATATDLASNTTSKIISINISNVIEAGVTVTLVDGDLLENPSPGSQYNGSFDIVLTHQPTADVTIPLTSSDITEGTVQSSVTFTPSNWNIPQRVIVYMVDDLEGDGAVSFTIATGAASTTSIDYATLQASNIADVVMTTQNNDPPGITAEIVGSTNVTSEVGASVQIRFKLLSQPANGASVTIPLSLSNTNEGILSASSITIDNANWSSTTNIITVTGKDDAVLDGDILYQLITGDPNSSLDPAYDALVASDIVDISLINQDNEVPDVTPPTVVLTHSGSDLLVRDADTETIIATFSESMTATPTITIALSNGTSIIAAALSGSGTTWTYPWNVPAGSDGTATVTVAGSDLAGNAYTGTTNLVFTIDNITPSAPVVNSQTTNDVTPTITGTAEANTTVTVTVNGTTYTTTAHGSGNWSITTNTLSSGTYSVTATSTDAAGNESPVVTGSLTVDNIAPSAPVVNNQTTNDVTPTITGSAEANTTVSVTVNGTTYTTTANSSGNWSITTTSLASGTYSVTATATDAVGNVSPVGTGTLLLDNIAPSSPVVNSQTTNDVTPTITGTAEANATVSVTVNGTTYTTTANGYGNWSITTTTLPSNTYSVTATATDAAGNVSPVGTGTLVVDNIAPTINGSNGLPGASYSTININENIKNVFNYTASEMVNWSINGGEDASKFTINSAGLLQFVTPPDFENPLDGPANGSNTYNVIIRAIDNAGNVSNQSVTVTVINVIDETPPLITGPSNAPGALTSAKSIVENTKGVYLFTANEASTWSISGGLDASLFTLSSTGKLIFTNSPDFENPLDVDQNNTYVVVVKATDATGNFSEQTVTITILNTVDYIIPVSDSDGDGVNDVDDLDDDNDGVLDEMESCTTGFNFSTITSAGNNYFIGNNSVTQTKSITNNTTEFVGDNNGNIRIKIINRDLIYSDVYLDLNFTKPTIVKFNHGSRTDWGNFDLGDEWELESNGVNYTIEDPNGDIVVSNNSNGILNFAALHVSGTNDINEPWLITTSPVNSLRIKLKRGNLASNIRISTDCNLDTDNDGIINSLDLDSDGDGCSDAKESGVPDQLISASIVQGSYGLNGLADAVESNVESGVISYTSTYFNQALVVDNTPPIINVQPKSLSIFAGNQIQLSTIAIAATGRTLIYQWFKNGIIIPGATNSILIINNASLLDGSVYYCQISYLNSCQTINTINAVVDVLLGSAPVVNSQTTNDTTPTITGTAEANTTLTVTVNGTTYTTTANSSGNWSITTTTLTSGTYSVTATATDAVGNVSPVGTGTLVIDNIADSDGDGILDLIESSMDTDKDGIPDFRDLDSDNDGYLDSYEKNIDTDKDGIPDFQDTDSDGDGILDLLEDDLDFGNLKDCDHDGIENRIDPDVCDLILPQIITPNGDGLNDVLKIPGILRLQPNHLTILNRWGNVVFEQENYQNTWGGNGVSGELPDGTYYYVVDFMGQKPAISNYVYLDRTGK